MPVASRKVLEPADARQSIAPKTAAMTAKISPMPMQVDERLYQKRSRGSRRT
jgi:hypothetical protein